MAKKAIKIRAKLKNDVTTVKALMTHALETGARGPLRSDVPLRNIVIERARRLP